MYLFIFLSLSLSLSIEGATVKDGPPDVHIGTPDRLQGAGRIHSEAPSTRRPEVPAAQMQSGPEPKGQGVGDVRQIEEGLEAAKATAEEAKISVEALRIEFEQRLNVARMSPPATPLLSGKESTVLFGGFGGDDFDDACSFINRELDKINIQRPLTQYFKGDPIKDPFNG